MTEKVSKEYATLLLAFIAGISLNGSFNALFDSVIAFSIFPLIALGFSIYCLHQRYVTQPMPEGTPMLAFSCFLLGLFLYSAIIRAEYAGMGSNFLLTIICVALVFWIGYKLKITTRHKVVKQMD
ncbi:YijD family membrane protein [Budviciaceae bacterium CWB-B4]|uniref:YijD family membrane protein n=1 Tax=Limnobaculum xujianqingii TaxID=2738837 RepID=A0A9D7AL13_9GAMM|nr:YijD family membrane protein [Limnobaculum xujianqingii]MBK5074871.1 YijD family membrane protein [Limnobaculum xujianqingii]MBK5178181.1 YijD family membrane protein [Limnobaculum xujianqingii]